MSQSSSTDAGPIVSGAALLASVRAAEAPLVGEAVKIVFFKQLGLDKLLELDLREHAELVPAALPTRQASGLAPDAEDTHE